MRGTTLEVQVYDRFIGGFRTLLRRLESKHFGHAHASETETHGPDLEEVAAGSPVAKPFHLLALNRKHDLIQSVETVFINMSRR